MSLIGVFAPPAAGGAHPGFSTLSVRFAFQYPIAACEAFEYRLALVFRPARIATYNVEFYNC